ncbi:hypothetical protein RSAG8_07186, partial [Rhizoctonia solani AG-8 WAC10335]
MWNFNDLQNLRKLLHHHPPPFNLLNNSGCQLNPLA